VQTSSKSNLVRIQSLDLSSDVDLEDFQKIMVSSLSHNTSLIKFSWKSDKQFLWEVDNKQTDRQTLDKTQPPWQICYVSSNTISDQQI